MTLDEQGDIEICTLTHLTLTVDDIEQLAKLYEKYGYGILEHILALASVISKRDCFNLSITDLIGGKPL